MLYYALIKSSMIWQRSSNATATQNVVKWKDYDLSYVSFVHSHIVHTNTLEISKSGNFNCTYFLLWLQRGIAAHISSSRYISRSLVVWRWYKINCNDESNIFHDFLQRGSAFSIVIVCSRLHPTFLQLIYLVCHWHVKDLVVVIMVTVYRSLKKLLVG